VGFSASFDPGVLSIDIIVCSFDVLMKSNFSQGRKMFQINRLGKHEIETIDLNTSKSAGFEDLAYTASQSSDSQQEIRRDHHRLC
jgi:hypothetical protein